MPSIHLTTISSSSPEGVSRSSDRTQSNTNFSIGETAEAYVLEKAGQSKYILSLKGSSFLADSDLPLKVGDKMLVTIEQLRPQLLLRLINQEGSLPAFVNDYLKSFRANPEALTGIFKSGKQSLDPGSLISLLPESVKANIRAVIGIMDGLFFSPASLKNPLYLKDYTSNLGLLLEYGLMKSLQERRDIGNRQPAENLKSALIKLFEELQNFSKQNKSMAPDEAQKLNQLIKFTETSLKAIETQQVINIFYQENDGKYLLQIPFLFPDDVRKGEIFIELEKGGNREERTPRRVMMFLSMDALGEIMVEATLMGRKIGCLFKFDNPDSQAFVSSFIDGLRDALSRLGYDCGDFNCYTDKNIAVSKKEYQNILFDNDVINLFA